MSKLSRDFFDDAEIGRVAVYSSSMLKDYFKDKFEGKTQVKMSINLLPNDMGELKSDLRRKNMSYVVADITYVNRKHYWFSITYRHDDKIVVTQSFQGIEAYKNIENQQIKLI